MPAQNLAIICLGVEPWIVPLFGVICCGVGLVAGRAIEGLKRRQPATAEPIPGFRPGAPSQAAGADQRVHPRYETRPFRLEVAATRSGHSFEGLVVNQSLGGLCVCVPKPFPAGTQLQVRGDGNDGWIPILVRNCRPHRGGWALGCQFVNGPSAGLRFN